MTGAAAVACGAAAAVVIMASTGGSESGPPVAPRATVASCARAYPAWFLASEAAGKTTATPAGCLGLSQAQVARVAAAYLSQPHG
jgi:hypothetical protein